MLSHSVVSDSLQPHGQYSPPGSSAHAVLQARILEWVFSYLQGIFPTQGSNSDLHHCRQNLHHLSHQGSPRILEWVAYPFSSGSSWRRNWTGVSCIAGKFFTSWATREAPKLTWTLLFSALTGFMSSLCILLTCIPPKPHSQYLPFLRMNPLMLQMCCKELGGLTDQSCPDFLCILGTDTPVIFFSSFIDI